MPLDFYIKEQKRLILNELFIEAPHSVLGDYRFKLADEFGKSWMRAEIRKQRPDLETQCL